MKFGKGTGCSDLEESGGTKPVRHERSAGAGRTTDRASACSRYDVQTVLLSKSPFQLSRFLVSVSFRLTVCSLRNPILCMKGRGGALTTAVIGARCSQQLHPAQDEQSQKTKLPEHVKHKGLPAGKSSHCTIGSAPSVIPPGTAPEVEPWHRAILKNLPMSQKVRLLGVSPVPAAFRGFYS